MVVQSTIIAHFGKVHCKNGRAGADKKADMHQPTLHTLEKYLVLELLCMS